MIGIQLFVDINSSIAGDVDALARHIKDHVICSGGNRQRLEFLARGEIDHDKVAFVAGHKHAMRGFIECHDRVFLAGRHWPGCNSSEPLSIEDVDLVLVAIVRE